MYPYNVTFSVCSWFIQSIFNPTIFPVSFVPGIRMKHVRLASYVSRLKCIRVFDERLARCLSGERRGPPDARWLAKSLVPLVAADCKMRRVACITASDCNSSPGRPAAASAAVVPPCPARSSVISPASQRWSAGRSALETGSAPGLHPMQ